MEVRTREGNEYTVNISEIVSGVEAQTKVYLNELSNVSMEQLCRKPSDDEWSLGQMMVHLMNSATIQLRNVELCRNAADPAVRVAGTKNDRGKAAFREGSFPPVRIHVPPTPEYTPAQPQSKDEIREGMQDVIARMRAIMLTVDEIPNENTVEHPGFGNLNAKEWFQLIEMHYRHHRHQLVRLQDFLRM